MSITPKDKIGGVRVSKVNIETLIQKLDELGCSYETNEPEDLLKTFNKWTKDNIKNIEASLKPGQKADYGTCEECHAQLPVDWEACPVCGTRYDEEAETVNEKVHNALLLSEQDLDDAITRIMDYRDKAGHNLYNLGLELTAVFENGLFKARLDSNGKQKFTSWDQFCDAEIGWSGSRCRTFMTLSKEFTENNFLEVGVEKLRAIARLDASERQEMLEKAPLMSTRELSKAVANKQKISGSEILSNSLAAKEAQKQGLSLGTEAAKEARERKKAIKAGEGVTAVFQLGSFDLDLDEVEEGVYETTHTLVNGVECLFRVDTSGSYKKMNIKFARSVGDIEILEESEDD